MTFEQFANNIGKRLLINTNQSKRYQKFNKRIFICASVTPDSRYVGLRIEGYADKKRWSPSKYGSWELIEILEDKND